MSGFIYHESFSSKLAAYKKYIHILLFLKKAAFLCKSKSREECYKLKLNSLKKGFRAKEYPDFVKKNKNTRLAVYAVLFGDYDNIKPVLNKGPLCDYYIITDRDVNESSGWKTINFKFPENLENADNASKNRYLKMHPELLFPEYEYSLYLDATMQPVCDLYPLLGRMGEHFIGMFLHETRNCIYKEAEVVVRVGKAKEEDVNNLISRYKKDGFPENFGLTAGGIILRRHNTPECKKIMNMWWDMYSSGPRRDQLSLMWCMWKNGYTLNDFAILGADYDIDPRFASKSHK